MARMKLPRESRSQASPRVTSDGHECLVCGRAIRGAADVWVHLLTTLELASVDEPIDESRESQGWFPIGPECARRIPAAFRTSGGD